MRLFRVTAKKKTKKNDNNNKDGDTLGRNEDHVSSGQGWDVYAAAQIPITLEPLVGGKGVVWFASVSCGYKKEKRTTVKDESK